MVRLTGASSTYLTSFLSTLKLYFVFTPFQNINFNYIFKTIIRYIIRCLIKSHGFGLSMLLLYYIGMYVAL